MTAGANFIASAIQSMEWQIVKLKSRSAIMFSNHLLRNLLQLVRQHTLLATQLCKIEFAADTKEETGELRPRA